MALTATPRPPAARTRRRVDPARKVLLGGSVMVMFGSFLPWVDTAVGSVSGAAGPGLWTFYAAMLGFAGVMVPSRRMALGQAAVLALVSLGLVTWQVVHLLSLVGTAGWMPGPGMVFVAGGGVVAAVAAYRMRTPLVG